MLLVGSYGVLYVLVTTLVSEYELSIIIGWITYIVSIALTFGVSVLVGLMVARKNKKIDMVEALKARNKKQEVLAMLEMLKMPELWITLAVVAVLIFGMGALKKYLKKIATKCDKKEQKE